MSVPVSAEDMSNLTLPTAKTSAFRWVVMGLIFLVYTLANADRANLGVALPYIRKEFHFSNTEAGLMISLFFAVYAIAQIPVGLLYRKLARAF